jgi:ribonuclease HI
MSTVDEVTIFTDGAARGNPGPAAYAYVIHGAAGAILAEHSQCLGETTNNVAEYVALVRALEKALELGAKKILLHSDSELMVKQMRGEYKVKNEGLRDLFEQAAALAKRFTAVTFKHVRRGDNSHADRLCNEALDGGKPAAKAKAAKPAGAARTVGGTAELEKRVRDDVLACLEDAAAAWIDSRDVRLPPVAIVWEQLWSILEENGVLRSARSR